MKKALTPAVVVVLLLASAPARAQLTGTLVLGSTGLMAGTQPPPGLLVTPFVYWYHVNGIRGSDGNALNMSGAIDQLAAPALNVGYVAPFEILGGHYGAAVQLWMTSAFTDFERVNQSSSSYGFGDMGVKPLELGWHFAPGELVTALDFVTAFQLWIPTGSYAVGSSGNTGLGQWGYEPSAGATVVLAKHVNVSTRLFYDIYSAKKSSVTLLNGNAFTPQTGNTLTLMGGIGYSMLGGALNVGIPYFVQWKVTQDTLPSSPTRLGILDNLSAAKGHSVGLGAEVDFFWSMTDGVQLRWLQAFDGKNTTNGPSFFFTYSHFFNLAS